MIVELVNYCVHLQKTFNLLLISLFWCEFISSYTIDSRCHFLEGNTHTMLPCHSCFTSYIHCYQILYDFFIRTFLDVILRLFTNKRTHLYLCSRPHVYTHIQGTEQAYIYILYLFYKATKRGIECNFIPSAMISL